MQRQTELVVLEEPPAQGAIKLDKALGTGLDGAKFFLQNYTTFQRRVRDAIIKKVDAFGFDVKLLADNDLYTEFKSKDGTLVGCYFDPEKKDETGKATGGFEINNGLIDCVKENNPDCVALYYRIEALIYNPATKKITVTVAFNFKSLVNNVTKSIGAASHGIILDTTAKDEIIDQMAFCAETAANRLFNADDMSQKLNSLLTSIRNAAKQPKGPLTMVVNAKAFDGKVRKKVMYMLKKELIAKKISSASKIKSNNTTLTAVIDEKSGIKEADTLYMEHISPILENLGVELDDDKVSYSDNKLIIKP